MFWISEEKLLTASLDKTCKIWDVNNSTVIATMATKEDKLEVEDMNAACGALGEEVMFSITLNGKINVWNMTELPKDSDHILTPSKVIGGTETGITAIYHNRKSNILISGDSNGITCIWKEDGPKSIILHKGAIGDIKEAADGDNFISGVYKMLYKIDSSGTIKLSVSLDGMPLGIAPSRSDASTIYVLLNNGTLIKIVGDSVKEKHKVADNSTCLEINEDDKEIYIGDKKGVIHIFGLEDGFCNLYCVVDYHG